MQNTFTPGMAFRFAYLWPEEDIFFFAFPCDLTAGEGLYRRFNVQSGFIEKDWYRFPADSKFLHRAEEWDFVR